MNPQHRRARSPHVRGAGAVDAVVVGAVLAGGASRRMGTDKALVPVAGELMVARVAATVRAAGAATVVLVGASDEVADAVAMATVPDDHPGSGPLGGLVTALAWAERRGTDLASPGGRATGPILLVAACDQPALGAAGLARLVAAIDRAGDDVVAARFVTTDGRRHPLPSAWRTGGAVGPVAELHNGGERRIGLAFDVVPTVDLATSGDELIDLDTPADVERWQREQQPPR